ncbi:MAG: sigma 54-interacting transcriptional regulator [Lentisphaeria bacterium]
MNNQFIILWEKLSLLFVSGKDVGAVLDQVFLQICSAGNLYRGRIRLFHHDEFFLQSAYQWDTQNRNKKNILIREKIENIVLASSTVDITADLCKDPRFEIKSTSRKYNKVAFFCFPFNSAPYFTGVMSLEMKIISAALFEQWSSFFQHFLPVLQNYLRTEEIRKIETNKLLQKVRTQKENADFSDTEISLIGSSPLFRSMMQKAVRAAKSSAPLLLYGEAGSGKHTLFRKIVNLGPRAEEPIFELTCTKNNTDEIADLLFGHEKNVAFEQNNRKIGKLETLDHGTLYLENIEFLSPYVQHALCHYFQEHLFYRIGGKNEIHTDVRVLFGNKVNLQKMQASYDMDKEFYNRLNIYPIEVPSLMERETDILLLAEQRMKELEVRYHKNVLHLSSNVVQLFMQYFWPGNIAELKDVLDIAVRHSKTQTLQICDLPARLRTTKPNGKNPSLQEQLQTFEKELLTDALEKNNGNLSAAGRMLGISPRMMHYKMHPEKRRI